MSETKKPVPVILDTDIGGDIDDTWALVMMLKSPELDVKMVVADTGDTEYRAKIIAKMLETAGRTDVPVGVGTLYDNYRAYPQLPWVEDYDLARYPGDVHEDGVGAMIETIMNASDPVTLICIGPVPNIGEALEREPRIAEKARFVGMHGSVFKGYGGSPQISAECNVVNYTPACQKTFTAPWPMTITPVDTCGEVVLRGENYQKVRTCSDPAIQALMENYRYWLRFHNNLAQFEKQSSVLFDTVAIYLAFADDFLVMRDLPIRVTDDGYTVVDEERGKMMRVATEWKDLAGFESFLADRLTGAA